MDYGAAALAKGGREAQEGFQIAKGELRPFLTIFGTGTRAQADSRAVTD